MAQQLPGGLSSAYAATIRVVFVLPHPRMFPTQLPLLIVGLHGGSRDTVGRCAGRYDASSSSCDHSAGRGTALARVHTGGRPGDCGAGARRMTAAVLVVVATRDWHPYSQLCRRGLEPRDIALTPLMPGQQAGDAGSAGWWPRPPACQAPRRSPRAW